MTRLTSTGTGAGAYLTGPVMPNPALLGYSASSMSAPPQRPMTFPKTTASIKQEPEISDQAVAEAIERLTKTPGTSPESLQQAALDMELVIRHFDSLSAIFGAEAALTSLALDLASNASEEDDDYTSDRADADGSAGINAPARTSRAKATGTKTRRASSTGRRAVAKV